MRTATLDNFTIDDINMLPPDHLARLANAADEALYRKYARRAPVPVSDVFARRVFALAFPTEQTAQTGASQIAHVESRYYADLNVVFAPHARSPFRLLKALRIAQMRLLAKTHDEDDFIGGELRFCQMTAHYESPPTIGGGEWSTFHLPNQNHVLRRCVLENYPSAISPEYDETDGGRITFRSWDAPLESPDGRKWRRAFI